MYIKIDNKNYKGKIIAKNNNIELLEFKKFNHGIGNEIVGISFLNEIKAYFPNIENEKINMIDNEYFICVDGKIMAYLS